MIWAVHNNHYQNAKILLEAGASWQEIRDVKGRTALDHALSSKMRKLFTEFGSDKTKVLC